MIGLPIPALVPGIRRTAYALGPVSFIGILDIAGFEIFKVLLKFIF